MKKQELKKEENPEDYCFTCKDGGHLRVCDFKNCLKSYHPDCVEKDDSFLDDNTRWTCGRHSCYNCGKSSFFQCVCCPSSYCRKCINSSKFAKVKKKTRGFCIDCLKMIKMIEEDIHVDSDGDEVDFDNRDTLEFLFKDYWRLIKNKEKLSQLDIQAALGISENSKNLENESDYDKPISEESMSESDESDLEDESENEKSCFKRSRGKRNKNKIQIKTPKKERVFIGWASAELVKFLTFIGKNTAQPLSQQEVTEIIKEYVQSNNLYQPKKRRNYVLPDEKLHALFKKKKLKYHKIYDLVKKHLVEEQSDDDLFFNSEEDEGTVSAKKQRSIYSQNKTTKSQIIHCSKKIIKSSMSSFAAIIADNIKLAYIKRSLMVELLKTPESFENKVVGCFVRIKNDPKDFFYSAQKRFQVGQIIGVKKSEEAYKIGESNTYVVLCISNISKDVKISMLTDDDIEEEECEDLRQLVKEGLFKQPTVAELERKIKIVHEDITNHWINREIVKLQKLIERANEKGWRKELDEHIDKRELLRKPEERMRLLKKIPEVIPDETRLNESLNVNVANKDIDGTSAEGTTEEPEESELDVKISIDDEKIDDMATWHYEDPLGIEQGPFTLTSLKNWKKEGYFNDNFKVWKSGECKEDAILLSDALASAFP